jgi:uncharacterized protein involved in exopolysaccharide biosynthesis
MPEENNEIVVRPTTALASYTGYNVRIAKPRDVFGILRRHWRTMLLAFIATLSGAILAAVLLPNRYTAHMKILVRHERADQVVYPATETARTITQDAVTDEEIDSEIELLKSQDILEKLTLEFGLNKKKAHWWTPYLDQWMPQSDAVRLSKAVQRLKQDLVIERIKKSQFIEVNYTSDDPEVSAKLLNALFPVYYAKHVSVRRPPGVLEFFSQQAEHYKARLADAEAKLAEFNNDQEAVAADVDRNMVLQKVTDLEYSLKETRATIAATQHRIAALRIQLAGTAPRMSTQIKKADNTALLADLKKSLSDLEMKRTEALTKYEPTYIEVRQLDTQIAQTQAQIELESKHPAEENTTDQNPTYQWLNSELAKATADLPTLKARADATDKQVAAYRSKIGRLDQKGLQQQDLVRAVKAEEENYLSYKKKEEEARISDQMDSSRIANVVIADAATVPAMPTTSHTLLAIMGLPLGILFSLAAAFVSDYFDPSFRSAEEVWDVLQLRVLAALPDEASRPYEGTRPDEGRRTEERSRNERPPFLIDG